MNTRILCAVVSSLLIGFAAQADEAVQINVSSLLTGRAVTTLTEGKLVPWTKGVDGGGRGNGYMTVEAAEANGDKDAKALPGDGLFKATATYPDVQLNFTNKNGKGFQIRSVEGEGEFAFPVPSKHYKKMLLFMTSAEGPAQLHFKLTYADGSAEERDIKLPDYYFDAPAGDPNVFSLVTDLPKWNVVNKMTEKNHHYLHGVDVHPDATKELTSVQVSKTAPGYLVFWGATGVTAK